VSAPSSRTAPLALAAVLAVAARPAAALDLIGMYVGGAVGQARVEASGFTNPVPASVPSLQSFKENHSAYELMLGVRPIALIGAELDYLDFGNPSGSLGASDSLPLGYTAAANVHTTGAALFGLLYLPIPVVDVYAKAGLARLRTSGDGTVTLTGTVLCPTTAPTCRYTSAFRATNTAVAAGLGAQVKFGSLAVRAEYERFSFAGAHPSLATIGVIWTFL
jgi:opacity protein-like surface antigen